MTPPPRGPGRPRSPLSPAIHIRLPPATLAAVDARVARLARSAGRVGIGQVTRSSVLAALIRRGLEAEGEIEPGGEG